MANNIYVNYWTAEQLMAALQLPEAINAEVAEAIVNGRAEQHYSRRPQVEKIICEALIRDFQDRCSFNRPGAQGPPGPGAQGSPGPGVQDPPPNIQQIHVQFHGMHLGQHQEGRTRAQTLCRNLTNPGGCKYGDDCRFNHNRDQH